MTGHIEVGLDEELALPEDSKILDYLDQLSVTIKLGPEVYFVVEEGYDYSNLEAQNKICSASGCHENSLLGQIFRASEHPKRYCCGPTGCIGTKCMLLLKTIFKFLLDGIVTARVLRTQAVIK